ncbi:MAG: glycogen/starch/alpha-glucan phosphorylase, partial [Planctomycetes bacterium]|nr:glycogen/starch/alpha-glucan phosphorylase [Planctomycetota bacterium]
IPELMRILIDENQFTWDDAWDITTRTFAYTNHTVLPEALEKWAVGLMEHVLPRHMQIIYEINQRFLNDVSFHYPNDMGKISSMSIIEEAGPRYVRMAYLAIIGSHSVNGVAALHTQLLKKGIFKDFYQMTPDKFTNKTNGVTPRRWIRKANPRLSALITEKIGKGWIKNLEEVKGIEDYIQDSDFLHRWGEIKLQNKKELATIIQKTTGVSVNSNFMFDVQIKRIHEYKRQLLNLMHVITLYNRIKKGQTEGMVPRVVIFAGKAAPGYVRAKEIIHLINTVAFQINRDPKAADLLKVAFIPNYNVSLAEKIFPGSDLSEQISTAGMEASGTGNMKFALNGALTIGTLDGANVEMKEEAGDENIFIFGKTVEEIHDMRSNGYYPTQFYNEDEELREVMDLIIGGFFTPGNEENFFMPIFNSLVYEGDYYFHMADYRSYINCQEQVNRVYEDQEQWKKMAVLNVARMSKFSSDRVIKQYAEEIWRVKPYK